MASESQKHLYLVDGSGYIFRAYYAVRTQPRSDGTPINAVLGFSNMIMKLLQDLHDGEKPTHFAVIFDTARRSFRNEFYEEYKSHRPPAPDDLVPQFPLIRQATEAFSVPAIEMENYEADDLIATYAKEAHEKGYKVTIISSDKDLMQLIGGDISMFDSMKNRHIYADQVLEKFGVGPDKVIDVQALAGDSADNVPGVPGIGVKTAAELINTYGDLDSIYNNLDDIKQPKRRQSLKDNEELARISKRLVTLKCDVPTTATLDDFKLKKLDVNKLLDFADEMEFKGLRNRVVSRHGNGEGAANNDGISTKQADVDYSCVVEMDVLDKWLADIDKSGIVAVDTETSSLNAMRAKLVGISLSVTEGSACYIPLRHGMLEEGEGGSLTLDFDKEVPKQLQVKDVLERLKPMLEDPSICKVGQNIKYDALIFKNEGINIEGIDDTMLMSYALDCGLHGHGMDELAQLHLGITPISFKEIAGTGKSQVTFDKIALDKATDYAAEDADITLRLYNILKPRLAKEGLTTVYETLERPLALVLAEMESHGIKVDRDLLNRLSNDFAERLVVLEVEIHKLAGKEFNIASPKQLGEVLFDDLGLEGGKKGKTGAYKTGVEILEGLAAEGHELPKKVLDWRQLAKLKNTYTDTLQKDINAKTGRVHTSFSMAGTSTGRLASSDPNIQNIPIRSEEGRKIRRAFIAEKGNKLIAADYSQIELRLLAHIADIDVLKKAFHEGLDIHAMTASEVFGVPIEGMPADVRRQAKAINFGIIYGISAFGLARQLSIPKGQAADYIKAYFERFPGIQKYMEDTKAFCHDKGYVETIFGRRCHVNMINDKNPMRRSFGERAAINAPIQGSAADVIKRAMVRMPQALSDAGLGHVRMLLQVHDELIFEAPEADVDASMGVINNIMSGATSPAIELSVPLIVDCGVGDNWQESH